MSRVHASFAVAVSLALLAARPAAAQTSFGDDELAARGLGDEGLHRFAAGRWEEAYDLFQRAERTFHAPTLVLYMAHCRTRLGDFVGAWRLYRSVAEEQLADGSPLQFQTAQGVAREMLVRLRQRVFVARVVVQGAPAGGARVLLDGATVPAPQLEDLVMEPGEHVVSASATGMPTVRRNVTAVPGGAADIVLPIGEATDRIAASPPPPARGPFRDVAPVDPDGGTPPPRAPRLVVAGGAALGLGAAALIAGTVTGAVSLSEAGNVKARCGAGGLCPASEQASAAHAGQLADASTGALVVGGLAAAAGIVLLVLDHRRPRTDAPAVHVDLGPLGGTVGGQF